LAFTQSTFQNTASKACAHGEACCWLKGGSFTPATGSRNETSGQIHRPPNLVSPASVPIRMLTEVTIVHVGGPLANATAGEHVVCTLSSTAGGWTRETETFAGGVVLNATAVRCRVNASADLGGLASLSAVTASGGSVAAQMRLHAQLSVSIGRQPYTDETTGQLLVRLSADAFPAVEELSPMASLLLGGRKHSQLMLTGPALQRGRTTVLSFALESLPPIFVDSNATVTFELRGVAAAASALPFVLLGQTRASQSVLDYATGAVLTGPERVPLLPNGFDSHFSSLSGAPFDERLAFSLARRGFNTVIFGACLDGLFTPECTVATLTQLDALGRYGLFGLIGSNWDTGPLAQSVGNPGKGKDATATTSGDSGGPPMNGLSAFINNVRSHPALLGYYLFDVSCTYNLSVCCHQFCWVWSSFSSLLNSPLFLAVLLLCCFCCCCWLVGSAGLLQRERRRHARPVRQREACRSLPHSLLPHHRVDDCQGLVLPGCDWPGTWWGSCVRCIHLRALRAARNRGWGHNRSAAAGVPTRLRTVLGHGRGQRPARWQLPSREPGPAGRARLGGVHRRRGARTALV
jgi:hypothetical protein